MTVRVMLGTMPSCILSGESTGMSSVSSMAFIFLQNYPQQSIVGLANWIFWAVCYFLCISCIIEECAVVRDLIVLYHSSFVSCAIQILSVCILFVSKVLRSLLSLWTYSGVCVCVCVCV